MNMIVALVIAGMCSASPSLANDAVQPEKGITVIVEKGETPSSVAEKHCGGAKNHGLVWKGDDKKLPIGPLVIPSECLEKTGKQPEQEKKSSDPGETAVVFQKFQNVGADPVCTPREIKSGVCREKQKAKLTENGRTSEQIEKIFAALDGGQCKKRFISNGEIFDGQINGSVVWGKTRVALRGRKGVDGFVCPAVDGRQEVFIPECGNISFNHVTVSIPEPVSTIPPQETLVSLGEKDECLWEATLFGEVAKDGVSGSLEASCQYQVNENTTAGWYGRASGGRYTPDNWTENRGGAYPLGIRVRQRATTFLGVPVDEIKGDLAIGAVYAGGGNGVDVEKNPLVKPSAWLAGSVRKDGIPITDTVSMTLEGMVFAEIPFGGKQNTITWQGKPVAKEKIRPTFGFLVRAGFPGLLDSSEDEQRISADSGVDFGFQDRGYGVTLESGEGERLIPEITGGIFFTPGDKNSPGGKLTVGAKNESETFRFGCGPRWPNVAALCDVELNYGEKQEIQDEKEVIAAQTEGATSTADHLKVTAEEIQAVKMEREISRRKNQGATDTKGISSPVPVQEKQGLQENVVKTSEQSALTNDEFGWGDVTRFPPVSEKGESKTPASVASTALQVEEVFGFNNR